MKKSYKQSCIVFSSDSSIMKIAIYCNRGRPEKNLAKSDRSFRTAPWHIKLGIAKYCIVQSYHIFKISILEKYCTLLYLAKNNCKFTVRGMKKL